MHRADGLEGAFAARHSRRNHQFVQAILIKTQAECANTRRAVKVPQIVKIVKAGSAKGVSITSELLSLSAYTHAVAYNFGLGFAFR